LKACSNMRRMSESVRLLDTSDLVSRLSGFFLLPLP
jgi:hypothetical protein